MFLVVTVYLASNIQYFIFDIILILLSLCWMYSNSYIQQFKTSFAFIFFSYYVEIKLKIVLNML